MRQKLKKKTKNSVPYGTKHTKINDGKGTEKKADQLHCSNPRRYFSGEYPYPTSRP